MIIIVDAYNLLKQLLKTSFISQKQRSWFISYFAQYAEKKHHIIYLVFDGGPSIRSTATKRGSVWVLYSGESQTADECIKDLILEYMHKQALVVSCDRSICLFATHNNIPTMDSLLFYELVQDQGPLPFYKAKALGSAHKLSGNEDNAELDALMQEGSEVILYKDKIDEKVIPLSKKRNLSKREKKLANITKKL